MLTFIRRRREQQRAEIARVIHDAMRAESERLNGLLTDARLEAAHVKAELQATKETLTATEKLLREQTEADAVLASLKVIAHAVAGKPRDISLERNQNVLMQRMMAQQNTAPYFGVGAGGGLGDLLGGLFH